MAKLSALPGHPRAERWSLVGVSLDSPARTSCCWSTAWSGASVLNQKPAGRRRGYGKSSFNETFPCAVGKRCGIFLVPLERPKESFTHGAENEQTGRRSGRCPEVDIAQKWTSPIAAGQDGALPPSHAVRKRGWAVVTLRKGSTGSSGAALLEPPSPGRAGQERGCIHSLAVSTPRGVLESRLMSKTWRIKPIKIRTGSRATVKWCSQGR